MKPGSSSPGRFPAGFTLIELMIVVAILAALMFVVVPRLQDLTDVQVKSSARRIVGELKYLYNDAVFKKRTYRLNFGLDEGTYWVEVLMGSEFVPYADHVVQDARLERGIRFKDVITERTFGASRLTEREEFIMIYPTGRIDPAIIYIEAPNGSVYTLETKPYTGRVAVYDEFVDFYK